MAIVISPSSSSAGNAFGIIQTPAGTSPTAAAASDTLTFTSSDGSVTITGTAGTDTVDFKASSGTTFNLVFVTKTANYTLNAEAGVLVNSVGAVTITLPVGVNNRAYIIKNINTGTVTVSATAPDLIDGSASVTIVNRYEALSVVYTNSAWNIF